MSSTITSVTKYIIEKPIKSMIIFLAFLLTLIVGITGFWPFFSNIPVLSEMSFGLYNKAFWENFLVEAHGFLLDFVIFGVIVFGFDHLRAQREVKNQKDEAAKLVRFKAEKRKKEEIERMLEELSDFSDLDLPEVNRKKWGHIRRLQQYGVKVIDVTQLTLNGCNIRDFSFDTGSRLIGFQLQDGFMTKVKFHGVNMRSSYFNGSRLTSCEWLTCDVTKLVMKDAKSAKGSKFLECNMTNADLRDTDLTGAEFRGSTLSNVKFDGATLDRADFRNVHDLNVTQLSKADSLNYLKMDRVKLEQLVSLRPDIKIAQKQAA
ncbi:pentapeptide repeat-containing protein [Vibrio alginolyticus]|uniref:pentapeptide repeat-containing protein n=1 Tax=Vibrio alginolyticus TaxID=663 RepID=UPI002160BA0C|nr:pentapeptide repeat-containing protein [Vibrio alginolyticus]ELA7326146.1 pentapeptide repeat-containing protein [Vibrio alginolyticus]MCS0223478.1 pentapeptide repeat-containing protein [Vibrio alginolyticus]